MSELSRFPPVCDKLAGAGKEKVEWERTIAEGAA